MATNMQKGKPEPVNLLELFRGDMLEIKKSPAPLEIKGNSRGDSFLDLIG